MKYCVLGLGISGKAACFSLLQEGHDVVLYDDSEDRIRAFLSEEHIRPYTKNGAVSVAESAQPHSFDGCFYAVCSPGMPFSHPQIHPAIDAAKKAGCIICCDIDLMARRFPGATHVALTGTNGKSTTVSMIACALNALKYEALLAGNIGVAAAGISPATDHPYIITECSSYQLDIIDRYSPRISVWLNITPDHIDRHGDIEGYIAAKYRIFSQQQSDDTACISIDDSYSSDVADRLRHRANAPAIITFSVIKDSGADVIFDGRHIIDSRNGSGIKIKAPTMYATYGAAARQNIAACYCVFMKSGGQQDVFFDAISGFSPLPHRMQPIAKHGNVTFINDSKATNADATRGALQTYKQCRWIVGGKAKSEGILPLKDMFSDITAAYTIGEDGPELADILERYHVITKRCGTLKEAVRQACRDVEDEGGFLPSAPDSAILLSPSCASFDQFSNFEERGHAFIHDVLEYLDNVR